MQALGFLGADALRERLLPDPEFYGTPPPTADGYDDDEYQEHRHHLGFTYIRAQGQGEVRDTQDTWLTRERQRHTDYYEEEEEEEVVGRTTEERAGKRYPSSAGGSSTAKAESKKTRVPVSEAPARPQAPPKQV